MSSKRSKRSSDSHSLLVLVLDVSPLAWGDRDLKRTAQDKARAASGKRSVGPAILEEVLESVQAFASAYSSLERDAGLLIIAVADGETALVYPRKNHLQEWLRHPESYVPETRRMKEDLTTGVAEIIARAASKVSKDATGGQAAMASAFSTALCIINRFLVAAKTGVSALQPEHYMTRNDDEGVIALMGNKKSKKTNKQASAWSPRILLIQASEDRSRDYNAFMNCAFAAVKHQIVVDGCFLTAGGSKASSAFLEQACDLTGGVFLAPSGAAQVGGALTEVLFSVFLSPLSCRSSLNLPALNKVDFRARCFQTGNIVDQAFVCNQCLSIFSSKPTGHCPTCQAMIHAPR
jgi:transcription initiation factor TFIIH subunit 3